MADPVTWTVLGSVALASTLAQGGYSLAQASEAKDKARHAANDAKVQQDQLLAEQDTQKKAMAQAKQDEVMKAAQVALQGYNKTATGPNAGGRAGTILTSPLGLTTPAPTAARTILGS